MRSHAIAVLSLLALSACPWTVHAAESTASCSGTISSLPATIATPGTWCLKGNLTTAAAAGSAITIAADHVTVDCNHFALTSTAGASGTGTGIRLQDRLYATVRHCDVTGFKIGILLNGSGSGHLVEDNHLDGNTFNAIRVEGDGSVVRRNDAYNTGGTTTTGTVYGIYTIDSVNVQDNTVSGVSARAGSNGSAYGIFTASNPDGSISGNRVGGMARDGAGKATGIFNSGSGRIALFDNDVFGDSSAGSIGMSCTNASGRARNNEIAGFATGLKLCGDAGSNDLTP